MRNPIDIVAELVARIDNTIVPKKIATDISGNPVYIVENVDGTFYFKTCDIKYLTPEIKINGYQIVSIVENGDYTVTVRGAITGTLTITQPRYYHGTAIAVNDELKQLETSPLRPVVFPMIYFPETRKPTRYPDISNYEMEADCRLVFAVNFKDEWTASDLKEHCINPMLELLSLFKNVVDADQKIQIESYSVEQFSKLGDKIEGKGTIFNAINDRMSGIVVDFTMSVAHDFECICCCPV